MLFLNASRLIEAFKSTPLYAHELREEYFRKVGLAGGAADGQSGDVILNLHPRTIDNDVKYYRVWKACGPCMFFAQLEMIFSSCLINIIINTKLPNLFKISTW